MNASRGSNGAQDENETGLDESSLDNSEMRSVSASPLSSCLASLRE